MMCLAAAYQSEQSDTPVLRDIARLHVAGDSVEIETLFGERRVIQGRLTEIDFTKSRVVIEGAGGA
jgi:predicted RNA-binding protein